MSESSRPAWLTKLKQSALVKRCQRWLLLHPKTALAVPSGMAVLLIVLSVFFGEKQPFEVQEPEVDDLSVFSSKIQTMSPNNSQTARSGVVLPSHSAGEPDSPSFSDAVRESLHNPNSATTNRELPTGFPIRTPYQDRSLSQTSYAPKQPTTLPAPLNTQSKRMVWLTGQIEEIPQTAPVSQSAQQDPTISPAPRLRQW